MSKLLLLQKEIKETIEKIYAERGSLADCETQSDIAKYWQEEGKIDGLYEALLILNKYYSAKDWEEISKEFRQ